MFLERRGALYQGDGGEKEQQAGADFEGIQRDIEDGEDVASEKEEREDDNDDRQRDAQGGFSFRALGQLPRHGEKDGDDEEGGEDEKHFQVGVDKQLHGVVLKGYASLLYRIMSIPVRRCNGSRQSPAGNPV